MNWILPELGKTGTILFFVLMVAALTVLLIYGILKFT